MWRTAPGGSGGRAALTRRREGCGETSREAADKAAGNAHARAILAGDLPPPALMRLSIGSITGRAVCNKREEAVVAAYTRRQGC